MERYRPGETLYESTSFLRQQCFAEVERDPGSFQRKGILYQSAFNQIQQQFSIVIRFLCTKASKPFFRESVGSIGSIHPWARS